mgnify:CR=1 FL=1
MLFKVSMDENIQSVHRLLYFVRLFLFKFIIAVTLLFNLDVASGGSEDWTRGTLNVKYSYCIELPPTGSPGFNVPTSEIRKTGSRKNKIAFRI